MKNLKFFDEIFDFMLETKNYHYSDFLREIIPSPSIYGAQTNQGQPEG